MIPKPKKSKKKCYRDLDPRYLWWLHSFNCCIPKCGAYPVHAHHVKSRGAFGADKTAIPLCPHHHMGWVHSKGAKTTQERFKVDFWAQVEHFNRLYDEGSEGPRIDEIPPFDPENPKFHAS